MDRRTMPPVSGAGADPDTPSAEGELLVSRMRLVLAGIALALQGAYLLEIGRFGWESFTVSLVVTITWGVISALNLLLIRRSRYRVWMSYLSTLVDIAMVTGIQVSFLDDLPLNFINGPVTTVYFVIIGLAALRKSRRLVVFAGVGSAVVHLTLSIALFQLLLPEIHLRAEVGGYPMGITLLDEFASSVMMAVVGWIIGHVTRDLRNSERHYQQLFEHVPDGVLITSADKRIRAVNSRFADMVGCKPEELIDRPVSEFLEHPIAPRSATPVHSVGSTGNPTSLIRTGGQNLSVRTVAMPIEYEGEPCVEMSVRDVTEQVRLEQQLAHSQKMETIGRLAGGLAHDFNNVLGGIIGATSLAERTVEQLAHSTDRDRLEQLIDAIRDSSERARDVVERLLTFSRRTGIELEPVDLGNLVNSVAGICRNTFGDGVQIEIANEREVAVVEGDETSLVQALLNLCINANDAMEGRGTLTITVSAVMGADASIARHPQARADEGYWCIAVHDDGSGMDLQTMERIFEPFFTTKPPGEGTGLGLAMVYHIAQIHDGFVDVDSKPGGGSTFRLYLNQARPSMLPEQHDGPALPPGSGAILVIDDDRVVRTTLNGMLQELGYQVTTAGSGEEALRLIDEGQHTFDLVLLDMVMPELDGTETLRLIRQRNTTLKVVIASGYWSESRTADLANLGINGFLHKPFTFADLAHKVHATLNPPTRGTAP